MAQEIIQTREQARQRGAFDAPSVRYWTERLTRLSLNQLLEISAAGPDANLNEMITARGGQVLSDNVSPDLGDTSADLVYTKVTPCRVADTRKVGAGGPLLHAVGRNFNISGSSPLSFTPQGGVPCGIPYPGATAVAVNLTVAGSTSPGWLRIYPYGGSGTASVINYSAGQTIANGLTLPVCDEATDTCSYDVTAIADAGGTHLLIDVMGYFQKVDKTNYRTFTVASPSSGGTVPISDAGCTNHISISITASVAGRVTVTSRTQLGVHHSQGATSEFQFGIATTAGSCSWIGGAQAPYVYVQSALPTGLYLPGDTAIAVFDVLAGTHTYYLNARRTGSGTGLFWWSNMTATFNPS